MREQKYCLFNNAKAVQKYLGDNHDKLKPIFQSAFEQEHSELVKALHGYELKLYGELLIPTKNEPFKRETGVQIPKVLFEDKSFKMIIVDDKGGYEYVKVLDSALVKNYYIVDLLIPSFSASFIKQINNKKFSIIVITNNISMKYNYRYYGRLVRSGQMGNIIKDSCTNIKFQRSIIKPK